MVSTRVEGTEELLANGRYGIIVKIDDIDEMVQALIKIETKTIHFDPIVLRNRIENHFSLEKMMDKTEQLFFGINEVKRVSHFIFTGTTIE